MQIIINNNGEKIVDPHNKKAYHEKWLKSIGYPHNTNYFAFKGVSKGASELITQYVLDLFIGKNLARGTRRGQRSYIHLCGVRDRLRKSISIIEAQAKKDLLDLDEDDILRFFNDMRNGTIKKDNGKPYLDVSTHAKKFVAFWRWIIRTHRDLNLKNIVEYVDTSSELKPKWYHFTLKDVEKMAFIFSSVDLD